MLVRTGHRGIATGGAAEPWSGGTETAYGGYTIHTFLTTGPFTVTDLHSTNIDVLVVAGGGGGTGGSDSGGGGGAGGVVVCSGKAVTPQEYTVTVGAGGVGYGSNPPSGNGTDSTFMEIVAKGGGGGGGYQDYDGADGGSGGGCPGKYPYRGEATQNSAGNQGGGTGYGYPGGGTNSGWGTECAGSGGGAGSKGYAAEIDGPNYNSSAPWSDAASPGGVGIQNSFQTGSNQWYGGGGASNSTGSGSYSTPQTESGGSGGGGDTYNDGTANTGGGGGGGGSYYTSWRTTGGSGIVVIRYVTP